MAEPWSGKLPELTLVAAAVDRELDDFTKRDSAMQARATILIGAASVIGAIQITSPSGWLSVVHLMFGVFAATAGVVVLFPRTGDVLDANTMWQEAYRGASEEELLHHTVRVKLDNLANDERSLSRRGVFARIGFLALAMSVAVGLAGVFVQ